MSESDYIPWLLEGRRLLAATCGLQLGTVRIILAYAISGEGVEFTLPPTEDGMLIERFTTAGAPATAAEGLTPTDQAILRVVEAEPHKAEWIARRIGRPCNSHFRSRLSFLCRLTPPLLARTLDGYRKPPAA